MNENNFVHSNVALMALMFSLMNIGQSIVAFDGFRQYRSRRGIAELLFVFVSHLASSFLVTKKKFDFILQN